MNPRASRLRAWLWYGLAQGYQFYGVRTGLRSAFLQAETAYNRALALRPDLSLAQYRRGILYWRELHDYPRAIADLSAVLDQFSEGVFIRGMAYQALGQYQNAIQDLQQFIELAPSSRYTANAQRQLHLLQAILEELPSQLTDGSLPLLNSGDSPTGTPA